MLPPISALILVLLAGCGSGGEVISLTDENNYTFEADLEILGYPLQAPGDPTVDWSAVTTDLLGHPLDPVADVVTMAVVVFERLSEDEVETALATDALRMSDVSLYVSTLVGDATSAPLSSFTQLGNDIDVETYFVEGSGTWLLLLTDTDEATVGARLLAFLEPLAASEETTARISDGAAELDLEVDLLDLEPLAVPAGVSALTLDWSALATNGRGAAWVPDIVDQVLIARFDDLGVADLQARFKDVEILADSAWSLDFLGGTEVDISPLAVEDPAFTGFDGGGTWILALRCSTCANPVPPFFTLVDASR